MKIILSLLFILSLGFSANAQITPAAPGVMYGGKTTAENAITVPELETKMLTMEKYQGKVTGTVVSVCEKKGCWMKLQQANGEGIMIRFKDYAYFMPKNIVGKQVVLDGTAVIETTSVEMLRHYAEDGGKSKEEIEKITEPKKAVEFIADAVLVTK